MSTTSLTAADVMDKSASLQNDTAKTIYTYAAQLPYLQMALDELQSSFELNNIPITDVTAASVTVPVGTTSINPVDGIGAGAAPNYPNDLVEIQGVYERLSGSSDPYSLMARREFIPHDIEVIADPTLSYWAFMNQRIQFASAGASTSRDVKIDYIKAIFPDLIDSATVIGIIGVRPFLYYKTAALCAQFIGENPTRAQNLQVLAGIELDKALGIGIKGKQAISTRRRPFQAGYRRRSYV